MLTHEAVSRAMSFLRPLAAAMAMTALCGCGSRTPGTRTTEPEPARYEHEETRRLVELVTDAGRLIESEGEAAFPELRVPDGRWRKSDMYVFVLDTDGNMLVHPDPALEGRSTPDLKDVNGRRIIRGLIDAATAAPGAPEGWYHYEWPVPGGLLPRWKSSYVRLVTAPSGARLVVGCGVYNDRMERTFVVDMVGAAVARIETLGEGAFPLLRDRSGPFVVKDAYVFVVDPNGTEVVNPAFPNLEGRNILDVKDTQGKPLVREMLAVSEARGSGWVDYMWPRPGESVSTQKSSYVRRADVGGRRLMVGAGVYLADAPKSRADGAKVTAPALVAFVREAASVFEERGEAAFPEFREKGSKWFHDDTYVFVWTADGTRVFNAPNPMMEGVDASGVTDALGRPYGKMFLDVARSPSGEGWVHYMFPEPGGMYPRWKSSFLIRVTSPSGKPHLVGCGIYDMQMDKAFVLDLVDRAASLVAARGKGAFDELRDRRGPFVFMDTYVFVDTADGVELVNPAQPSLEGKDLSDVTDANGKAVVREYIAAASRDGAAWVDYQWYRPGRNTVSRKSSYVRLVRSGPDAYVVGSGLYLDD
jgi:signal transduction histidine kinase